MPLASKIDLPERYRVIGHIASGGMASVWEAEDLMLGRVVAVKVLASQYASDPAARARFQREARTAAQVSDQSHVVTIYDIGEHGDDAFIVMEYFAGGTVADRLRGARDDGAPIARQTALRWLEQAAAGLDVAHRAQIVHRDVKPANLLLDSQDRLAVADFGIARLADDTQMTQTGQVLGTAAYLSPEQALGRPAVAASDRYALAVVAYELLTGVRPFTGGAPTAQALAHARDEPPRASQAAPDLPTAIDAVLARGLAKDPAARPASAREFVDELARTLGGGAGADPTRPIAAAPAPDKRSTAPAPVVPVRPSPPPAAEATPPPREPAAAPAAGRRSRASPALLGAVILAGALVALVLALSGGNDPQPSAGGGSGENPATAGRQRTATTPAPTAEPAAKPEADQGQATEAAPDPEPQPESPAALNDRGKALSDDGRYAEAVAPLRAAVDGYKAAGETDLPYAFALYNLGVALNRSGNPAEAVPLLRERLKYDNQTPTVQAELDDAISKLDAAPGNAKADKQGKKQEKKKSKQDRDGG